MHTIAADDGCRLNVKVEGPEKAPVLMLCNSLGTTMTMWDDQAPAFARHHRLVRYDRRGHGQSDAPAGPYSYDRLMRDALSVMNGLGLTKVNWCGLSMGGMTGMMLARFHPDRLDKVVLANTSAGMSSTPWNDRIRAALSKGMAGLVDGILDRWLTKSFQERAPQAVGRVRQMVLSTPAAGYAGCCAAIRDMDQRWGIRVIDRPTLVIVGSKDPATPPAAGELIHKAIAGSQLVSLDAAHLSNIERPSEFTDAVLGFLAKA